MIPTSHFVLQHRNELHPGFAPLLNLYNLNPPRKTGGLLRISVFWMIDFDCQPSRFWQSLLYFLDDIVLVGVLFHISSSSPSKSISYRAHHSQLAWFKQRQFISYRIIASLSITIYTCCLIFHWATFSVFSSLYFYALCNSVIFAIHVSCPITPISSPHRHSYLSLCLLRYPTSIGLDTPLTSLFGGSRNAPPHLLAS